MGQFEIDVFNDTMKLSRTKYANETKAMQSQVEVITQPISDLLFMPHHRMPNPNMKVSVINSGTVSAGKSYISDGRVAILNFADGCTPGGLVLYGEVTQEENICRCSNLYSALTMQKCHDNYYKPNMCKHGEYTNNIIYARDVLFFKDDSTYESVTPYYMDVITCPAPSANLGGRTYDVISERVLQIVKSAIYNKVDVLVLGAWGCGAFGQSPELVSAAFMNAIKKYSAFDKVIFAVRSCIEGDVKSSKSRNYEVFKKNCEVK